MPTTEETDDLIHRYWALSPDLGAAASLQELRALEEALACTLPADVAMLYREHDGMRNAGPLPLRFMAVGEAREWYAMMRAYDERTRDFSWIGHGVRAFWSDDQSNHAGVYVSGALAGRVCLLDHEQSTTITPTHRSVRSFLAACVVAAEQDLGWWEMPVDYPELVPPALPELSARDWTLAQSLYPLVEAAPDRDDKERWEREHHAFCIMALTPVEHTRTLLRFARDHDMWVQAYACDILGRRRYEDAVLLLAEIAESGTHNGRTAAVAALGRIGTSACLAHILRLAEILPHGWEVHLGGALRGCGCEVTHEGGRWRYRLPGSEEWTALELTR